MGRSRALNQPQQGNQHNRPHGRRDQRPNQPAGADAEHPEQIPADDRPNHPQDEIAEQPVPAASHNLARKSTCGNADQNEPEKSHNYPVLVKVDSPSPLGHTRPSLRTASRYASSTANKPLVPEGRKMRQYNVTPAAHLSLAASPAPPRHAREVGCSRRTTR